MDGVVNEQYDNCPMWSANEIESGVWAKNLTVSEYAKNNKLKQNEKCSNLVSINHSEIYIN